ncbi:GntR family transcriptional regulator [Halotalea alkalilenta]|nr:GntR family transcriptional regulator [Halotalea alkalilenta]
MPPARMAEAVGQRIRPRRLADEIVRELERLVLEGNFVAGERLPAERVLAERFGVSRPTLREAIQRLAAKGLLSSRQGGGTYVSSQLGASFDDPLDGLMSESLEARHDLLEYRHLLEGGCAYYAALRATDLDRERLSAAFARVEAIYRAPLGEQRDEEAAADVGFHLVIAEVSHNLVLLHSMRSLHGMMTRNTVINIAGMHAQRAETRDRLFEQHRALFEAIRDGQARRARALSGQHIDYVREVLLESEEEALRFARARRRQEARGALAGCGPDG